MSDVNASWQGEFIRHYDTVDISVAVQTPVGLMVPIVRDADNLGLLEINSEVKSLAKKVRLPDFSNKFESAPQAGLQSARRVNPNSQL